ncbi:MAG TPA: IPTL-CTERM sorting domain-containing protein [Thermoanaerobaculia bacterium]|nr:IPTL-CTERM sorting domain-containing protein [Thermoanaerobaculia bacterium]
MRTLVRSLFLAAAIVLTAAPLVHAQEADILVTKDGPSESDADTDVSYSVTVTNLGPDDSSEVTLTDGIPSGMTFVSGAQDSGPAFSCSFPTAGDTVGSTVCTIPTLTTGSTATFTFVFHIPAGTPPGTAFVNIATVSSATDPNDENNSAPAGTVTPFPPQGDMSVTKTGPNGAGPDTDVVYTITIHNAGPDDAENVQVNDTLPGTMTFVSLAQSGSLTISCTTPSPGSGGTITCEAATCPVDGDVILTITGHIPAGTQAGETYENVVSVTSNDDPNDENDQSATLLIVSSSDVEVEKTGPATATAGSDLTYTIIVSNNGPDAAVDVQLNDPLPAGTTFVSLAQNSGPVASCSTPFIGANGTVACTWAVLGSGASATFTLVVEAGNITEAINTATVSASGSDGDPSNNSSTVETTITPEADVSVVKNGPTSAEAGSNISYTITVTNDGPSDAEDVELTDTVPANTTFVSATQTSGPSFNCTGTVSCTIATLAPNAVATFEYVVNVAPSVVDGTVITNTASVSTTTDDSNTANDSSSVNTTVETSADVSVVKTGPTAANAGSDITYTITVTNSGPSDAASVTLTDTVPANTMFVSSTQTSGPTFNCVGTMTCTIATLVSGATATFDYVVNVLPTAPDGTVITNTADVTTTTTDPVPGNNSSSVTTTVSAVAEVTVVKIGPGSVSAGSNVNYEITVTNNGPADAFTVTLTDILPANTTFISLTQSSGPTFSCTAPPVGSAGTVTCTIATLTSGAIATFDLVLNITNGATGTISNTATVTSPSDPTPGDNSSTTDAEVGIAGVPTLSPYALVLLALALAGIVLFRR